MEPLEDVQDFAGKFEGEDFIKGGLKAVESCRTADKLAQNRDGPFQRRYRARKMTLWPDLCGSRQNGRGRCVSAGRG